jgi:hypothetical protein
MGFNLGNFALIRIKAWLIDFVITWSKRNLILCEILFTEELVLISVLLDISLSLKMNSKIYLHNQADYQVIIQL